MTGPVARLSFIRALARDRALSPSALVVGIELLAHLNNATGTAWPSPARMATALGISLRSIRYAVAELAAGGWFITADTNKGGRDKDGRAKVTRYRPCWEKIDEISSNIIELNRTVSGPGNGATHCTVNSAADCTVNSAKYGHLTVQPIAPELLNRTRKEEHSATAPPPAGSKYAFQGEVIRLTEPDFEKWKATYHKIPDLKAELTRIDAALAEEGRHKRWFAAAAAKLNAKHQRLLEEQKPARHATTRKLEVLQ